MRVSTLAFVFTLVLCAFAALPPKYTEEEVKVQWNKFKNKHGKLYGSEEPKRFEIFKENVAKAHLYNQISHDEIYGITKFSDLTEDEFKSRYLMKPKSAAQLRATIPKDAEVVEKYSSNGPLPESFDWREKGAVTGVKDQGGCGSCWAFSTTGNIEGQMAVKHKNLVSLSEQNLVDCDHHCVTYQGEKSCDQGCGGGLMWSAMEFIKEQGGIDTEDSYPYEAFNDQCRFQNSTVGAKVTGVTMLPHTDAELAAWLIDNGPISVAMNANWLQYYTGGISNPPLCSPDGLDHGVLIVGFGKGWSWLGPVNYWIVKNSWTSSWGEQGYFRIAWGKCGLTQFPSSAIVA